MTRSKLGIEPATSDKAPDVTSYSSVSAKAPAILALNLALCTQHDARQTFSLIPYISTSFPATYPGRRHVKQTV